MSSPSALIKVNYLVMRYLHFGSVRGDLQEGHGCASRCQFLLFLCRSPFFQSAKSRFLCAFALRNPCFRAFRAQNRGFCAFLASETLVFGLFEHKISIFVLGRKKSGIGKRNHGEAFASSSRWWFLRAYCHRDYLLYLTSTRSHSLSPG